MLSHPSPLTFSPPSTFPCVLGIHFFFPPSLMLILGKLHSLRIIVSSPYIPTTSLMLYTGRSLLRCARLSSHHRRYISSSTSSLHSSATKNSFDIKQPTPHDYTYNSTDTEYTSPSKRKKWSWIDPKTVKVDGAPLAPRNPLPPYMTREDAVEKTKIAERAWNTRNPEHVAQGYSGKITPHSHPWE